MRKIVLLSLTVLGLLYLTGCNKQENSEKETASKTQYTSEDYKPGTGDVMVTDKGFYYVSGRTEPGVHYYDPATERSMYLCNKPECRHDGNEFCVATNSRYGYLDECIYSGKLFLYAVEETETQYLFKLLAAELDGSGMNEVATVMELEKTGNNIQVIHQCGMMIHRNTAVFEIYATGTLAEEVHYYGVAIMDINTGEVSWLDEEPFGADNVDITEVSGFGDWIYYCRKEGKKTLLHRYHITEKTDEVCKFLVGFSGEYVVKDEDTVLYLLKSGTELYSYRYSTGENTEEFRFERDVDHYYQFEEGTEHVKLWEKTSVSALDTDGEYLYASEPSRSLGTKDENGDYYSRIEDACIYVLNREFETVTILDMADVLPMAGFEEEEWYPWDYTTALYYCGEDIYWELKPQENMTENYIFRCNRSDFLAGNPEFEFVYRWEW